MRNYYNYYFKPFVCTPILSYALALSTSSVVLPLDSCIKIMLPLIQTILRNRLLPPITSDIPEEQTHRKQGVRSPYTDK